jgi:hypothetical protein
MQVPSGGWCVVCCAVLVCACWRQATSVHSLVAFVWLGEAPLIHTAILHCGLTLDPRCLGVRVPVLASALLLVSACQESNRRFESKKTIVPVPESPTNCTMFS